jgi:small conductance mechanosensitive channel
MASRRLFAVAATMLMAATFGLGVARAQTPAPATPAVTPQQAQSLVKTLQDPAARQKLIDDLNALAHAQPAAPPPSPVPERVASYLLERLSDSIVAGGEAVLRTTAFLTDAPKLYDWARQTLGDAATRARLAEILSKVLLALGVGWAAEYAVVRTLRGGRAWIEQTAARDGWARGPLAILSALVAAVPVAVFVAVAFGTLTLSEPSRPSRLVTLALINAHVLARLILVVVGAVLAPRSAAMRLAPIGDETAAYLQIWCGRITGLAVYGYFLASAALLVGVPHASFDFLIELLGLAITLLLIVLILQNRGTVAAAIEGTTGGRPPRLTGLRRLAAEYWHVPAILYVGGVFVVWLVRPNEGFLFVVRATIVTVLALVLSRVAVRLTRRGFDKIFRITGDIRQRFPTLESRANSYLQLFNVTTTVLICGFAALVILNAWGLESFAWFDTPFGQRVATSVISVAVFTAIAVALWEIVNALLERYAATAFGPASGRRSARGRTIITLVQRVLLVVLAAVIGLVILSEIGINIGPLLAGAGVLGLAVGLGAQTMIKNLIEGVAIILEDSFAVGDVVEIGGKSGVIEAISMRMVRLRDYSGYVHTIPFSQIVTITNMTREFAFAVFDIGVGYGEDIDHVVEVVKAEAAELRADPKVGPAIVADLEIAGVDKLGDSAVVIKTRFKIQPPIEQWNVSRAFNRRIKLAFDRERIEIPFPQRTIHVADMPRLNGAAEDQPSAASVRASASAPSVSDVGASTTRRATS